MFLIREDRSKMTLTWSDKGFEGELPVIKDQAQMWEPSGHHHWCLLTLPAAAPPSGPREASCFRCSLCTSQSSWCLSHDDLSPLVTWLWQHLLQVSMPSSCFLGAGQSSAQCRKPPHPHCCHFAPLFKKLPPPGVGPRTCSFF